MATNTSSNSRTTAFMWVILSYIIAIAAGVLVGKYCMDQDYSLIWSIGAADLVATIIIFLFSYFFNNSSFYDPYWSVIPIVVAVFLGVWGWDSGAEQLRIVLLIFLVSFWGIRLTYNWAMGWPGTHHQDWRYDDLQTQTGKLYWLVSFSGIHLFPTILVFMGMLALIPAMTMEGNPMNWLDLVATLFTLGAILVELVADEQLRAFVRKKKEPGETLTTGLWAYSRHPNYFGETAFWWGLFLFTLAARPDYWWVIVGPVGMTLLFNFISIPMIEKRMLARRKNYALVIERIPKYIPWFPKK